MSEIILNDIKPSNLNIKLNKFCKDCSFFKPEIETTDYTLPLPGYNSVHLEIEAYDLTCTHMAPCLKHYDFKNYISYNDT